ncbi:ubiquitin domain-containing protein 7SL RNA1-like [Hibiscus syriacus]|uniref:ubiquitin domain-containing protein 7SL RNA1-like n=1 Tax=Hibiscus syriacus TaxID=106335 RepID=UPI001923FD43|nr:ubiquitin domain-containing protein 7SL RNA1-like [Hibiscus syriacus]
MDVIFETQSGKAFSIEVDFFDTVLEIKGKVQKYEGTPVDNQTLIFNGQVLQNERDVEYCEILQYSRIQLRVAPASDIKNKQQRRSSSPLKEVQLNADTPLSESSFPFEIDDHDMALLISTDAELRDIKVVLQSSGAELHGDMSPGDCMLTENDNVDVNIKKKVSPTAAALTGAAMATRGSKKMKLWVLPMYGTKKIPVAMNANDNVGELRKELQKLQKKLHFDLSEEGYFFIHKQNVMEDDRSFKWHQVVEGDTIEIFNDRRPNVIIRIIATGIFFVPYIGNTHSFIFFEPLAAVAAPVTATTVSDVFPEHGAAS